MQICFSTWLLGIPPLANWLDACLLSHSAYCHLFEYVSQWMSPDSHSQKQNSPQPTSPPPSPLQPLPCTISDLAISPSHMLQTELTFCPFYIHHCDMLLPISLFPVLGCLRCISLQNPGFRIFKLANKSNKPLPLVRRRPIICSPHRAAIDN